MKNGEAKNEAAKDWTWTPGSQASALGPRGTGPVGTVLSEGSCDPSPAASKLGSGSAPGYISQLAGSGSSEQTAIMFDGVGWVRVGCWGHFLGAEGGSGLLNRVPSLLHTDISRNI